MKRRFMKTNFKNLIIYLLKFCFSYNRIDLYPSEYGQLDWKWFKRVNYNGKDYIQLFRFDKDYYVVFLIK